MPRNRKILIGITIAANLIMIALFHDLNALIINGLSIAVIVAAVVWATRPPKQ